MATMSIIGEKLARKGASFVYEGPHAECEPCKLRKVCHQGLTLHQPYTVTEVRPVQHDCCTLFEGKVSVVQVEPASLTVAIPESSLKGTAYTKRWEECGAVCLFKKYCNPRGVAEGKTLTFEQVGNEVPCLVGRKLRFAQVRPAVVKKG